MPPAPPRFLASVLLALIAPAATGAEAPARSAPMRPGGSNSPAAVQPPAPSSSATVATRKLRGLDYVSVAEVGKRLGLAVTESERGRKARLAGGKVEAELTHDDRDATINGLRVVLGEPAQASGGQLFVSRVDFERAIAPLLRPGFGVPARPRPRTIVLDPGHGGRDQGTSVNEKTYALDVARRAKPLLEAAGFRVVLTRDADVGLELFERAGIANQQRGDAFVSIHFNALPSDTVTSGVQVFTFAPAGQHAAEWWSTPMRGADPHLEKSEMPVNRHDHWSAVLAQGLHRRLVGDLKAADRGKKIAHWGVLRPLDCPGVLIECGFLTSAAEARKISTPAYRQKIAEAIAAGLRDYAAALDAARARGAAVAAGATGK
ncbi:MAG: N-acetylmuramoyl-L-alanine amidase [Opitutaceae bacterium]|nr:N-acetylmuramoyl-L-alanine amidase [Opitutaceae bacterium]